MAHTSNKQMHSIETEQNQAYFVVYVCDVHAVQDVVFEVVPQYPSQNIKRYVRPVQRHEISLRQNN